MKILVTGGAGFIGSHTYVALKEHGFTPIIVDNFSNSTEKVISQLKKYFGSEVEIFESYHDKIWDNKYIQPSGDIFLPPHFNNGHAVYRDSYMNGGLFFTGTETSNSFSGYMEGAIIASNVVAKRITTIIKSNKK